MVQRDIWSEMRIDREYLQHDRQHADSYGRGGHGSEDRRPQSWNRAPAESAYASRPTEAHVASASFANLGALPCSVPLVTISSLLK